MTDRCKNPDCVGGWVYDRDVLGRRAPDQSRDYCPDCTKPKCRNPDCVDGLVGDEFETWSCPDCTAATVYYPADEMQGNAATDATGGSKGPFGCKCQTLNERVTGDGCDECNPEMAEYYATVDQTVPDGFDWSDPADVIEAAWGIIANAHGGDWSLASADWREAAERWRDNGYDAMIRDRFRAPVRPEGFALCWCGVPVRPREGGGVTLYETDGERHKCAPVREPDGDALAIARELDRAVNAAAVALTAHDEPTADVRVDLLERARDALHEAAFGTAPARPVEGETDDLDEILVCPTHMRVSRTGTVVADYPIPSERGEAQVVHLWPATGRIQEADDFARLYGETRPCIFTALRSRQDAPVPADSEGE